MENTRDNHLQFDAHKVKHIPRVGNMDTRTYEDGCHHSCVGFEGAEAVVKA